MMSGQTELYKALHLCVNAAGGDCTKVLACFGAEATDEECAIGYAAGCDGNVRRYCDLGDRRVYRIDCAAGGLACAVDDQGEPYCGAGPCTTADEVRCDGTRRLSCLGSGLQIEQCDVIQLGCGLNADGIYDCIGTGKECEG
jgi:hypothetical protein